MKLRTQAHYRLLGYSLLLVASFAPSLACTALASPPAPASPSQPEPSDVIEFLGRVVLIPVEGEFYGIVGPDGSQYIPLDLDPQYKQDGLVLRLRAERMRNVMGIHMWGSYLRILEAIPSACLEESMQIKDNCPSP